MANGALQALQAPLPGKPQQPMPDSEFRNDNIHNIPQQRFQSQLSATLLDNLSLSLC
jgi:hypothetical protein